MDDIRELCWKGNLIGVRQLIERQGVDVNDKHAMNGTTPLHWAVKGGYTNVVSYLISHGANPDGQDSKGVTPRDLAAEAPNSIRRELGLPDIAEKETPKRGRDDMVESTAFIPFPTPELPLPPLAGQSRTLTPLSVGSNSQTNQAPPPAEPIIYTPPAFSSVPPSQAAYQIYDNTIFLQLGDETDVIEVDLPPITSFRALLGTILQEFQLKPSVPFKIRKLPNILVRNDKDVARIKPGSVLQIVPLPSPSSTEK